MAALLGAIPAAYASGAPNAKDKPTKLSIIWRTHSLSWKSSVLRANTLWKAPYWCLKPSPDRQLAYGCRQIFMPHNTAPAANTGADRRSWRTAQTRNDARARRWARATVA